MAVFENVIVGILIAGIIVALGASNISRDDRDSVMTRPSDSNIAYPVDTQEGVRMSGDYSNLPTATEIPNVNAYKGGKTKRKFKSRKQSKRKK
jgi:hypothetical protein